MFITRLQLGANRHFSNLSSSSMFCRGFLCCVYYPNLWLPNGFQARVAYAFPVSSLHLWLKDDRLDSSGRSRTTIITRETEKRMLMTITRHTFHMIRYDVFPASRKKTQKGSGFIELQKHEILHNYQNMRTGWIYLTLDNSNSCALIHFFFKRSHGDIVPMNKTGGRGGVDGLFSNEDKTFSTKLLSVETFMAPVTISSLWVRFPRLSLAAIIVFERRRRRKHIAFALPSFSAICAYHYCLCNSIRQV